MTALSTNFELEELTRSDVALRRGIDTTPSAVAIEELKKTAEMLEQVRTVLGDHQMRITSGFRCLALNRAVGSQDTSAHILGQAADFQAPSFGTPLDICRALKPHAASLQFDQLIYEFGAWVHIGRRSGLPRFQLLTIDNGGTRVGFD